jgi:DNA primase
MIRESQLISLLDRALNQSARLRKGVEAVYFCPFCNHYKKKLEINVASQNWHCWVCHAAGKSIRSLFRKLKVTPLYYTELYKITGDFKPQFVEKEYTQDLTLPKEFISLSNPPEKTIEYVNALSYLQKRRVTIDDIARYNIGYCVQGDYRQMIIVPSYDKAGNINFFAARAYYDKASVKHKLAPWSKNIIGFELFINWNEPITIVEGTFDAIAIRKNAIPLFGTMMSEYLRESIILNGVERVNLILDTDAMEEAMRIRDYLEKYEVAVHFIKLGGKDPSSIGFEKVNQLINESVPMDFSNLIKMKLKL